MSPFFPAMDQPITKIGLVVRDAARTAKSYSEMFELGPWSFYDLEPAVTSLAGRPHAGGCFGVRLAANQIGDKRIELLQPLYGTSPYRNFLQERGEGVHHLAFPPTNQYGGLIASAPEYGLTVEMEAAWPGSQRRLLVGPWQDLGILIEFSDLAPTDLAPWGHFRSPRPGWISVEKKRIGQIGIVTDDSERMARRYHELFGIKPWVLFDFKPPIGNARLLHDVTVCPGTDHLIKAAIADHCNLQFEFLQPVIGPSTHLEYLQARGQGAHHLSFDIVDDHDELVANAQARGLGIEMAGIAGDAYLYTYLDTRDRLGTFWEVVKFYPEEDIMAGAYGIYPPE